MRVKLRQSCLPYSLCSRFGGHGKICCTYALYPYNVGWDWVQEADPYYHHFRSWVLILGMSGLIVLFWFVGESAALRYFVSISFTNLFLHVLTFFSGTFHWGHVMLVLRMGCDRLVGMVWISVREPLLNP